MSGTKRYLEHQEAKQQAAIQIAIESGALKYCKVHDDILLEGSCDIEEAYKLGDFKFTQGQLNDVFDSREEMKDLISKVIEFANYQCERCNDPD
ncbi:hypothetical protein KW482_06800 [Vibrio fluvialis]|nr:hypothetical protein [Vibrio fluvialis]EKO5124309.1 hypothetical protein [Vibrio fluvialis]MBY7827865.1 hypothetical protein [Vibrio fluvialis]MBY8046438.1 hypothetical protein [Vibrio fluvialis]MBY8256634.1 hypothetical protein [Vibrio fluvialis]